MFVVDNQNMTITLSRGDTGTIEFATTGYTFASEDRAIFTVKDSAGVVRMERICEIENGEFTVYFHNPDTDTLPVGSYSWDVRFVINPYYDASGRIVDGDQVVTPYQVMQLNILNTAGEV